jgi:hypothetical protein
MITIDGPPMLHALEFQALQVLHTFEMIFSHAVFAFVGKLTKFFPDLSVDQLPWNHDGHIDLY